VFGTTAGPGVKAAVLIGIVFSVAVVAAADMIARAIAAQGAARAEAPGAVAVATPTEKAQAAAPSESDDRTNFLADLVPILAPLLAKGVEALQGQPESPEPKAKTANRSGTATTRKR
jgi:hypothetical protein